MPPQCPNEEIILDNVKLIDSHIISKLRFRTYTKKPYQ